MATAVLNKLGLLFLLAAILVTAFYTSCKNDCQGFCPFRCHIAKIGSKTESTVDSATVFQPLNPERISFIATRIDSTSSTVTKSGCFSELGITESRQEIGFASLLLMTLDHISFCILAGSKPAVYWRGGLSFLGSKNEVKKASFNSWSLFFEPLPFNLEDKQEKIICLGRFLINLDFMAIRSKMNISNLLNFASRKNNSFLNDQKLSFQPTAVLNLKFRTPKLPNIDFEGLILPKTRMWVHSLIKRFIKVKKPIKEKSELFYRKHLEGYHILGVHIRGTDHILETDFKKLPNLELWIKEAELIYTTMPYPKKIFVASDNTESLEKFVNYFGVNVVVFTDALRAPKYDGPNIQPQKSSLSQQLAVEVLIDILLLSKCHHFLHGESSVAAVAHYFNLDMETYFLGELSASKSANDVDYTNDDFVQDVNEDDDDEEVLEKYEKHSHTSVCPDMSSRKFLPDSELGSFFDSS